MLSTKFEHNKIRRSKQLKDFKGRFPLQLRKNRNFFDATYRTRLFLSSSSSTFQRTFSEPRPLISLSAASNRRSMISASSWSWRCSAIAWRSTKIINIWISKHETRRRRWSCVRRELTHNHVILRFRKRNSSRRFETHTLIVRRRDQADGDWTSLQQVFYLSSWCEIPFWKAIILDRRRQKQKFQ